jgi:SAM-dependent methyltransferase
MVDTAHSLEQHNREIHANRQAWERKPALRAAYREFHARLAESLAPRDGLTVELGSGNGAIKETLPDCITTDIFPNPWLDRVENAYELSFGEATVANLILFDVWHHLRYPGAALREIRRVLVPGGRLLIFDPAMGGVGRLAYGLFHHEPLGMNKPITWDPPPEWSPGQADYYAAQGNAWRMFQQLDIPEGRLNGFTLRGVHYDAALSYLLTGGFRGPSLLPMAAYDAVRRLDRILSRAPRCFASRMLVVLEKNKD